MVAALKKLTGGDVAGRFAAWWDGRAYSPGDAEQAETPAANKKSARPPKVEPKAKPLKSARADRPDVLSVSSRVAAIEMLWGEGRFMPANAELYARLSEGVSPLSGGSEARFGVLNADPALVSHMMGVCGGRPVIADWRLPCVARFRESFADFDVLSGDIDRPSFEPGTLELIVSCDAFAFSDHKAGLAGRVMRSLAPGGQWLVLDTVRTSVSGNLAPAFASAWGEPQLAQCDEIGEICDTVGFQSNGHEDDVTGDIIQASRSAFNRFGQSGLGGLDGVDKVAFMQELAWEAESWKWRQRAFAAGFIQSKVWKFKKPEN